MGLLKRLIGNAVSEGIGKGISSAVEKATEKIVAPAAEKWANKTADQFDSATEAMENVEKETGKPFANAFERLEKAAENYAAAAEKAADEAAANYASMSVDAAWDSKFAVFPKWDYTPITNVSTDEGDDYLVFSIYAEATEEMINDYRARLDKEGFPGDMQIRSKTIGDERYVVDFTFAEYSKDNEIRYAIEKK